MVRSYVPTDIRFLRPGQVSESQDQFGQPAPPPDRMAEDIHRLVSLRTITTGITSRAVVITSSPTLIVRAPRDRAYTIINPTPSIGLTSSGTFLAATNLVAAGNSQAKPLGVSNYDTLHLFFNVANAAGLTLNVIAQVLSPINNVWIDVQDLVPAGITANADVYFNLGNFGITTQFALRWTIVGTCTLTAGFVLKGGLGGSSAGLANTIFIGNSGVNVQAGYPILEGQFRDFYMAENAELWGVVNSTSVSVNVIELA
jgi:hypothetical protein